MTGPAPAGAAFANPGRGRSLSGPAMVRDPTMRQDSGRYGRYGQYGPFTLSIEPYLSAA